MVTTTKEGGGISQPSDSDFLGRAKRHPAGEFAKDRPAANPEQQSEDEATNGSVNSLSITGWKDWFRFDARGPWLKENGGLIALAAAITIASIAAVAWRIWK